MTPTSENGAPASIETVRTLLKAASDIVADLARSPDALALRWRRILERMPGEDREIVAGLLEREVDLRLLIREDELRIMGVNGLRPNPAARIYIRLLGCGPDVPDLTRDEIIRSVVRAARVLASVHTQRPDVFERGTLDAFRVLSADERTAIRRMNSEILALLDRADSECAGGLFPT